jgi:hypothetical protein
LDLDLPENVYETQRLILKAVLPNMISYQEKL